jgi:pimeloyl-ACP methyl ester carboxylesterase
MTTYALVHGAWHDAWCWEPVAGLLREGGDQVVAPNLPCDDPTAGLADYADAVIAALPEDDEVVLVGHSLGALTVSVVAAARPARALVYVAGIIGVPGKALADLADVDDDRDGAIGDDEVQTFDNGTFVFTPVGAMRALYHDCDPDVARDAIAHLRPQRSMWNEVSPIDAWPAVPTASIVCSEDRVVNRPWAVRTARERLGVEPVILESGHSPMLAQPVKLFAALAALAAVTR